MAGESYGSVWQRASADIAAELGSGRPAGEVLRRVLGLGYFSQFTSYPSPAFNAAVVAWLERHLAERHGFALADLPAGLEELDIAPAATIVERSGRRVSPDLLRYVAYAKQLEETWRGAEREPADILEIGGGYGGLARALKTFHPNRGYWLTDLPEALRCAEIYLHHAFPDARIVRLDAGHEGPVPDADFRLVPVQDAARLLAGRSFGLAINIWSFGEMPNEYVERWFRLLQQDCRVDWLFTINSFMAPVTPVSVDRVRIGDWLFRLDERWAIERLEIDTAVHRCPLIRNFPTGIALLARRIDDESEIARRREAAAREMEAVLREDWASIAADARSPGDAARPERMLDGEMPSSGGHAISCRRLFALTDYIGHFNIEAGAEDPFPRLWNAWRLDGDERAGALLVAYLGMAGKSDLERRCTKEELLLLRRLPEQPLHGEYAAFAAALTRGKIAHDGRWLTDQEACDRALDHKKAGEFAQARVLWTKVTAAYPAHGDAWFQLALLLEIRGELPEAAIRAAHAVHLGCPYYAAEAERFWAAAANAPQALPAFGKYFGGEPRRAMGELARAKRAAGEDIDARALEQATAAYP